MAPREDMYGANPNIPREPTYSTSPPLLKTEVGPHADNDGRLPRGEDMYMNGGAGDGSVEDEYTVMSHALSVTGPNHPGVLPGDAECTEDDDENGPAYSILPHPTLPHPTLANAHLGTATDPAGSATGKNGYVNSPQAKGLYARARAAPTNKDMLEHPYSNMPSPATGSVPRSKSLSGEAGYINSTMANEALSRGGVLTTAATRQTPRPRRNTADSRESRYSSANAAAVMLRGPGAGADSGPRPRAATISTPTASPGASLRRGVSVDSGLTSDHRAFSSDALEEAMARPPKTRGGRPVYKTGSIGASAAAAPIGPTGTVEEGAWRESVGEDAGAWASEFRDSVLSAGETWAGHPSGASRANCPSTPPRGFERQDQDSFRGFDDGSGGGLGIRKGWGDVEPPPSPPPMSSRANGKKEFTERSRPLARGGGAQESFRGFNSSIKLNDTGLSASVET